MLTKHQLYSTDEHTHDTMGSLPADQQKLIATIDTWKRKLLDLSKRNRALSFKPNPVSTIVVTDEMPTQVFRRLYVQEGAMRFRAMLPEPPKKKSGEAKVALGSPLFDDEGSFDPGNVDDGVELPAVQEIPLDPNRHQDDVLQAHASPSGLDNSLRRIAEQAITTLEEQGVNALYLTLGMLHYRDLLEPDREFRAPLVLLPVTLNRSTARSGFSIRVADDEPVVNPTLAEYLRPLGITLPALPDSAAISEDYDLQTLLDEVAQLVAERPGWSVHPDLFLGLFSFQKLAMYRDLEANAEQFLNHRLIRQIVTRTGTHVSELPDDVRALNLDRDFAPEATAQVVDADSSQLRAIAAVAKGHDLVLEGPPGTGKSQTITNLIGQALADGKRVLFVAEKMAALNVVHQRLEEAGLGEFCLELHSTKTNKLQVLQSIKAALDASVQTPAYSAAASERLPALRATLNEYTAAVHAPHGALDLSPYTAYGELGLVLSAPKVRLTRQVDDITQAQITDTVQALTLLARAVAEIGDPNAHPWRETTRTFYSVSDLEDASELLADLAASLDEVDRLALQTETSFGLPPVLKLDDTRVVLAVAEVLEESPGAPAAVLESEEWNAPPPHARALVERGRRLTELRAYVEPKLRPETLETEHEADIAFIEEKESSPFRLFNVFSGRHRLLKKRWLAYRLSGYAPTLLEQAEDMKKADALRRERAALAASDGEARALFGALWTGEPSDWDALDRYIAWVAEFRAVCVKHGLKEQAAAAATKAHPDLSLVRELDAAGETARTLLVKLRALVGWPTDMFADTAPKEIAVRIQAMASSLDLAQRWASYETARAQVGSGPAAELLPKALAGEVAFADLQTAFRRAFYQKWVDAVVSARPLLREFHTLAHEQRIEEFQELDRRVLLDNRRRLVGLLRDQTQARLRQADLAPELGFLRGQMNRQRRHAPLRRTLREAGRTIQAIKPCFLMSPLTVAQLLGGPIEPFDLVVFDEASQLPTEDAAGAIVRGKQLTVVGDPKQLPPTNFFAVMSGQLTTATDEHGNPLVDDTESVLEECLGAGLPTTRLKWHYRSREESLITFSNASFYNSDLLTFPSVYSDAHARGLSFEYVADGVYEGKGLNMVEARRVADAVVEHARKTPKRTLGVGTFNLRQQIAILDELELRRRQDPSIEPFFDRGREEPFFVKNLENIQGDERDVILLSITYAKNQDGVLRHNFGPINGENGWRRLNVITTRARQQMRVISSMRGDEIDLTKTQAVGARYLRDFLLYAERGRLDSTTVSAAAKVESPFEAEVFQELSLRGLRLQPQVGVAGYRIDLGVLDDDVQGRFVCGIECDGVSYHASQTARDRDRLRQQVLEGRGWTIHRIWSTDWFKDRQGQIERILSLVEASRQDARDEAARLEVEQQAQREAIEALAASTPPAEDRAGEMAAEVVPEPTAPMLAEVPVYELAVLGVLQMGLYTTNFHDIPVSMLIPPLRKVVETEAPLHIKDLATRVVNAYGFRQVGSRIAAHIDNACKFAEGQGVLRRKGDFIWGTSDDPIVRSRAGTGISADRIAPEEYRAAALQVLQAMGAVERKTLVNEVRALFGFSRTGPQLEEAIQTQVDALLADGTLGEGGSGLVLRG